MEKKERSWAKTKYTQHIRITKDHQEWLEKNKGKYPDAVFIITDGYGDPVTPEISKRWYWFLSCNYRGCIPKECNIFDLADYE